MNLYMMLIILVAVGVVCYFLGTLKTITIKIVMDEKINTFINTESDEDKKKKTDTLKVINEAKNEGFDEYR